MMARAMAVRCFWPPERVSPRSPDLGVEAFGEFENFCTDVSDGGGFLDCSGEASGSTEGDVLADGLGEAKCLLRDEADAFAQCGEGEVRIGWPSIRTVPGGASWRRGIRETNVDFPEPVGPTMARLVPAGMLRLMSWRTDGASG